MVSSIAICDIGAAQPCIRAVYGAIRATAVRSWYCVRILKQRGGNYAGSETGAGDRAGCGAKNGRGASQRNRKRIRCARPAGMVRAKVQSRRGEEIFAARGDFQEYSSPAGLEILGHSFWRRGARAT